MIENDRAYRINENGSKDLVLARSEAIRILNQRRYDPYYKNPEYRCPGYTPSGKKCQAILVLCNIEDPDKAVFREKNKNNPHLRYCEYNHARGGAGAGEIPDLRASSNNLLTLMKMIGLSFGFTSAGANPKPTLCSQPTDKNDNDDEDDDSASPEKEKTPSKRGVSCILDLYKFASAHGFQGDFDANTRLEDFVFSVENRDAYVEGRKFEFSLMGNPAPMLIPVFKASFGTMEFKKEVLDEEFPLKQFWTFDDPFDSESPIIFTVKFSSFDVKNAVVKNLKLYPAEKNKKYLYAFFGVCKDYGEIEGRRVVEITVSDKRQAIIVPISCVDEDDEDDFAYSLKY